MDYDSHAFTHTAKKKKKSLSKYILSFDIYLSGAAIQSQKDYNREPSRRRLLAGRSSEGRLSVSPHPALKELELGDRKGTEPHEGTKPHATGREGYGAT